MSNGRILAFMLQSAIIGPTFVLSSPAAAAPAHRPAAVGYLAAFKGLDLGIDRAHLPAYTHLNIAFANPDAQGRFLDGDRIACMPAGPDGQLTVAVLKRKIAPLQANGAKLLVSLGGGVIPPCSGDWKTLLAPDKRASTVAGLVAMIDALGLDGVDVDIEGELLTAIDRAGNYVPFIAALSAEMRKRGKLLTCATASYEGGMVPRGSVPYFDLVNVMSYDAIGPSWGPAGAEHSTYEGAARDLALWRERGVPRERLVLGVPFYGYGFNGEQASLAYRDIAAAHGAAAADRDLIGTACAGCRYVTYNGVATIERKARLAGETAGGVMVWELSQDTPDHALTRALSRGLAAGAAARKD